MTSEIGPNWREQYRPADFREADLERNRGGRLARGQPAYTFGISSNYRIVWVGLLLVGIVVTVSAVHAGDTLWALLFGLVVVAMALLVATYWLDSRSPLVKADGGITTRMVDGMGGWPNTRYFVFLNADRSRRSHHMRFWVPKRVFDQIAEGGPYRVYYTPRLQSLVNLEPLAGWRPRELDGDAEL